MTAQTPSRNRVLVSGAGVVSSLGKTLQETWDGLVANKSGVRQMPDWKKYKGLYSHVAAPAPEVDISFVPRSARRTMSRMSHLLVYSAREALAQAGLSLREVDPARVLIIAGSTTGSPQTYEEYFFKSFQVGGPEGQLGTSFFKVMNHSVASNLASALEFSGPLLSPSSACSTSAQAIVMGWEFLQSGLYDVVIAGGADELHHTSAEVFDIVFAASRTYNDSPDDTPRPFDQKRDGLVVSEGAGLLVLETEKHLRGRGRPAIGEICGGAYTCAGAHMSRSDADAMLDVMNKSLARSSVKVGDIQYANAHATATLQGDQAEAEALGRLLGDEVPVSSLKGHLGHSLSPCGAIEAAVTFKMIQEGLVISTRNLREISEDCRCVRHLFEHHPQNFGHAISTNFAFGGMNTSLILGRGDY